MDKLNKITDFLAGHYEEQTLNFMYKSIKKSAIVDGKYFLINKIPHADDLKTDGFYNLIVTSPLLNNFPDINESLRRINNLLVLGGIFIGRAEELVHRKRRIRLLYNKFFSRMILFYEFIFKRVLPKLFGFRYIYRNLGFLKNRIMSKCEVLGRLQYCGFEIVDLKETNEFLYFVVYKKSKPLDEKPSDSLLIKIKKIGLHGRTIYCYKLRTMHAYAGYLHDYILKNLKIDNEGKVVDDFRKTAWGMFLRKTWLDEIPQLYNLLKGDLSFIGLRPLSQEFLSKYPAEWRAERIRIKPGIVPPYYADCPKSFAEIIESEKKYYRLKSRFPITTDIFYLIMVLINFVLGKARTG